MKPKKFVWKGPATWLELWDHSNGDTGTMIFGCAVEAGTELPVAIDPEHETVRGWIAFKLIEELPEDKPAKANKENIDG